MTPRRTVILALVGLASPLLLARYTVSALALAAVNMASLGLLLLGCTEPAAALLAIQAAVTPLLLAWGYTAEAIIMLVLYTVSLYTIARTGITCSPKGLRATKLASLAVLASLGCYLAASAYIHPPPPDLYRAAKSIVEKRLLTWHALGLAAGVLHLVAGYEAYRGRMVGYLLAVGLFLSPLVAAAQAAPAASPPLFWCQLALLASAYTLGLTAARRV